MKKTTNLTNYKTTLQTMMEKYINNEENKDIPHLQGSMDENAKKNLFSLQTRLGFAFFLSNPRSCCHLRV